jgi:hypothetical protein
MILNNGMIEQNEQSGDVDPRIERVMTGRPATSSPFDVPLHVSDAPSESSAVASQHGNEHKAALSGAVSILGQFAPDVLVFQSPSPNG